ncbi:hypothetical protein [Streptomyces sp. CC208A]|uniref:hypothetical protein n=1 Tax=Streptomyces sp. CC208A TaxID=3044573 RepID=UPI0024A93A46|nr:hypothetical protein [Streptomyces sp. CC208A]
MLTLNVVLGLGCLAVFFLSASRSSGRGDRLLWAAVLVLAAGGTTPRLLGVGAATVTATVVTALSLAVLLLVLGAMRRR